MTLPRYITFTAAGDDFICDTKEPHYIAKVVFIHTDYEVKGGIFLQFAGTLGGNRLMYGADIEKLMNAFASYYRGVLPAHATDKND